MKLLLLLNGFPSEREPTRDVFNLRRFSALARYAEVRVVMPRAAWSRARTPGELFSIPVEESTGLWASFPTYWSLPGVPRFHGTGMYLSLRRYLARLRREFPFDALLAAWAYPHGFAAARLAQDFGCPLVTMVLGSDVNELTRRPSLRGKIGWALGQSQRVVAVSAALRDRVVELGIRPERVLVQRNGVDGDRFTIQSRDVARRRLGLPASDPIVCYVGNLAAEKGVDLLVDALYTLHHDGNPQARLALVGGGALESDLRQRAKQLRISERIHFAGRRPHDEVPAWLSACDVFCLASRREGCPNVIIEALAAGRPVVAASVGGVPELLNAENGIAVAPGSSLALAAGLREALGRPWNPARLRSSVANLSWEPFGQSLHDLMAALLRGDEAPAEPPTVALSAAA